MTAMMCKEQLLDTTWRCKDFKEGLLGMMDDSATNIQDVPLEQTLEVAMASYFQNGAF